MKRKIVNVLLVLLFLIGFGVMAYPAISNQWNTYQQNKLINSYQATVKDLGPEDFASAWEEAKAFNETLEQNDIYRDVFGGADQELEDTEYWNILNLAGDGIMGYLHIPSISVKLPIYHGVEEDILQTASGHLNGTRLPIGGEGNHSVLAAHRGLPSAKLFTDIDQLQCGDKFYICVLDEILAYEVDQILDMVDKDDMETLSDALQIEEGKDQVTLFTCTPYGVNSHRLLVRGTRVPYNGELLTEGSDSMLAAIKDYYMLYLVLGLATTGIVIFIMKVVSDKKRKKKADL